MFPFDDIIMIGQFKYYHLISWNIYETAYGHRFKDKIMIVVVIKRLTSRSLEAWDGVKLAFFACKISNRFADFKIQSCGVRNTEFVRYDLYLNDKHFLQPTQINSELVRATLIDYPGGQCFQNLHSRDTQRRSLITAYCFSAYTEILIVSWTRCWGARSHVNRIVDEELYVGCNSIKTTFIRICLNKVCVDVPRCFAITMTFCVVWSWAECV